MIYGTQFKRSDGLKEGLVAKKEVLTVKLGVCVSISAL